MNQSLIEGTEPDVKQLAQRLRALADKIELNDPAAFGGAFIILPPPNGGDVIETLILDGQQDAAQFYILLNGRITKAIEGLDSSRTQQAFRR